MFHQLNRVSQWPSKNDLAIQGDLIHICSLVFSSPLVDSYPILAHSLVLFSEGARLCKSPSKVVQESLSFLSSTIQPQPWLQNNLNLLMWRLDRKLSSLPRVYDNPDSPISHQNWYIYHFHLHVNIWTLSRAVSSESGIRVDILKSWCLPPDLLLAKHAENAVHEKSRSGALIFH